MGLGWDGCILCRARLDSISFQASVASLPPRPLLPLRRLPAEEAYCLPGLLPAAGRLANAAVALLGPDYTFGSPAYLACKSIINDMRALEEGGEH